MHKILGSLCFFPIVSVLWSFALGRLSDPDASLWALPYLVLLTLGWLALRLRSTSNCLTWLVIQLVAGFFFALPAGRMRSTRAQGQLTGCKSNLKNLATALEMFSQDHQGLYPSELGALVPGYLKTLPNCPSARQDTYSLAYFQRDERFTLRCSGEHHRKTGTPSDYPRYSSSLGLIER